MENEEVGAMASSGITKRRWYLCTKGRVDRRRVVVVVVVVVVAGFLLLVVRVGDVVVEGILDEVAEVGRVEPAAFLMPEPLLATLPVDLGRSLTGTAVVAVAGLLDKPVAVVVVEVEVVLR